MIDGKTIHTIRDKPALSEFIDARYDGDYRAMISEISRAVNKHLMDDLKAARELISEIGRIRRYYPEQLRPKIRAIEARYLHWTGDSRLARDAYRKAAEELHRFRDYESAAQARLGLMDALTYLGEHDRALDTGRSVLRYYRRKENAVMAARVMTNIGNVYHRMDRNHLALSYYDKARAIFEGDGGIPLAVVDYNRANIYANLNQLDRASELYTNAAEIYSGQGMELAAAKARYSLGYIHFLSDRYTKAIAEFEDVIDEFERLGDEKACTVSRLDLSEINLHLNQYGSAVLLADRVIAESRSSGLEYEAAKAAFYAAEAYLELDEPTESRVYLRSARKTFSREQNSLWIGMCDLMESRIEIRRRRYSRALDLLLDARKHFRTSGDRRRQVDAELTLAEVELHSGKRRQASRRLRKLLDRRVPGYQKHRSHYLLGLCELQGSDVSRAAAHFEDAMRTVENILANLYPDELQHFYLAGNYDTYLKALECYLKLGKPVESCAVHARSLSLLNGKHIPVSHVRRDLSERHVREREKLRAQLKKLKLLPPGGQRSAFSIEPGDFEQELWTIERKLRMRRYRSSAPLTVEVDLELMQSSLREDETILSYAEIDDSIVAFVVTRGSVSHYALGLGPAKLRVLISELSFICENSVFEGAAPALDSGRAEAIMTNLREELLDPVLDHAGNNRLVLLVDGIFAQVPFWAIRFMDGKYVHERFSISIICDPADIVRAGSASRLRGNARSCVLAVESDELPMINIETEGIAQSFPGAKIRSNGSATVDLLASELKECDGFVHIATHAARSSENPLFSKLLMSDGPFYPFDLFEGGVSAELVVLSGCQTAAPGIYYGNTFSLAKAFYQAGARYVLASLWPVSDKISMLFMRSFYRSLAANVDVPLAYSNALSEVRDINDDPSFWAPFVLLGM